MLLSAQKIHHLLTQSSISADEPWAANNPEKVDDFYKNLIRNICEEMNCASKVESDDYGSGYASYIDAWFYKPNAEFSTGTTPKFGSAFKGLIVLLSRLSPYYVFMEGEKHWHAYGGSSYLPAFSMVDDIQCLGVKALAVSIQEKLDAAGLIRLTKADISSPLPLNVNISTNLTDQDFTEFDAIFYWED